MPDQIIKPDDQEWVSYFLTKAEEGDPMAQIAVGWEYVRGKIFEENVDVAFDWFRRSEEKIGEIASFHILKLYYMQRDFDKMIKKFQEKESWQIGALYLPYASYLLKEGRVEEGIKYLDTGRRKGSLYCAMRYYRTKYRWPFNRFLAFPIEIAISVRMAKTYYGDQRDPRLLT